MRIFKFGLEAFTIKMIQMIEHWWIRCILIWQAILENGEKHEK